MSMRCRKAERAVIDRELGLLDERRTQMLELHLESCSECGAVHRERRWVAALVDLRSDYPFVIDVSPRVMRRLEESAEPRHEEVSGRQLGWGAVVAVACGLGLAVTLWGLMPEIAHQARQIGSIARGLWEFGSQLVGPALALLSVPIKLIAGLVKSLDGLGSLTDRLQPAGTFVGTLSLFAMTSTIAFFVGRDLRRPPIREGH